MQGGLALVGTAAGIALAVSATRAFASLLFGVSPIDPWTFAIVSLGLIAAVVAASYVPAWPAAAGDPVQVLRAGAK